MFAPLLRSVYQNLQRRHPGVLFFGDPSRPAIALTFDDGPHPRDTPEVLDMLAKHGVRATFFLIGQSVEQYPNLVRQIYQSGHQLGLHCHRHLPFPLENALTLKRQLDQSRTAIACACDIPPESIRHVRPPYGAFTGKTLSHLTAWGYRLVMWTSIPQHWMQPITWSIKQVLDEVFPGAIIVLHDGHGHGKKVAQILDIVLPQLKAKGFEFVTIEQTQSSITGESK